MTKNQEEAKTIASANGSSSQSSGWNKWLTIRIWGPPSLGAAIIVLGGFVGEHVLGLYGEITKEKFNQVDGKLISIDARLTREFELVHGKLDSMITLHEQRIKRLESLHLSKNPNTTEGPLAAN